MKHSSGEKFSVYLADPLGPKLRQIAAERTEGNISAAVASLLAEVSQSQGKTSSEKATKAAR